MNEYSKIPPQAVEIEERLLGEIIEFPQVIDDIVSILSVEDFYKESHKLIYRAIYDLWSEGKSIDLTLVTNRLRKTNELEQAGGAYFVTKLTEKAIHPKAVKDHCLVIKEKSVQRKFILYGSEIEKTAYDANIDELLTLSNGELDKITDGIFRVSDPASFKTIVDGTIHDYYERKAKAQTGEFMGIKTPLLDLNKITGGWQPSDLIIIAGRPSMGKTAFAVQCCVTAARKEFAVDVYTLEMSASQFAQRIMSCVENIDIEKFRTGSLPEDQEKLMEQSVNKMLKLKINLDDKSGITADYIKAKSSANKRRGGCDFIIVDYLQLMSYDEKLNSNEGYGSITRKLKGLAKDLDIPVILLSQLNRAVEARGNRRPMLSDLRSSGEIEQDADLVIFPYRNHYYSGADEDAGQIEIIVAKHRNGRIGVINAKHNETITQFYDQDTFKQTADTPF
jgi:replicative DNA helicase